MPSKLWDLNQSAIYKAMLNSQQQIAGLTASLTGASVDMIEGEGNCHLISDIQFSAGTGSPTCQVTLQESTDGTTWTQCTTGANYMTPSVSITTAATTAPQAPSIVGPFTRNNRFLRPIVLMGGNSIEYVGQLCVLEQRKYTF